MTSPEQGSPPNCAGTATGRSRVRLPPLHGRSHFPQSDQSSSTQFTGVLVVVTVCVVVEDVVVLVVSDVVFVNVVILRCREVRWVCRDLNTCTKSKQRNLFQRGHSASFRQDALQRLSWWSSWP